MNHSIEDEWFSLPYLDLLDEDKSFEYEDIYDEPLMLRRQEHISICTRRRFVVEKVIIKQPYRKVIPDKYDPTSQGYCWYPTRPSLLGKKQRQVIYSSSPVDQPC